MKRDKINPQDPRYTDGGKTDLGTKRLDQDLRDSPEATLEMFDHDCSPEQVDRMLTNMRRIQREGHRHGG